MNNKEVVKLYIEKRRYSHFLDANHHQKRAIKVYWKKNYKKYQKNMFLYIKKKKKHLQNITTITVESTKMSTFQLNKKNVLHLSQLLMITIVVAK